MERPGPSGFIVVLNGGIMEIPYESNLSWLTLFYALPKELVEKRPVYLELPRNPVKLLNSEKHTKLIKSDAFLELIWDSYAWIVWKSFQIPHEDGTYHAIPGDWSHYSGNFPLWRFAYLTISHIRNKFETEMGWSFQRLFSMDENAELPWLSYQQFWSVVGNLTDKIVSEQNWQPMIDDIWRNRQVEDYSGKNNNQRDFMRSWTHARTAQHISLEEILETGVKLDNDVLFEIADPLGEFETKVLSGFQIEQFKQRLTDQDRQILQMRCDEYSLKEIAAEVGFQSPSAVSKRIKRIADAYEEFVSEEYDNFLDEHIV